jgi:hypothetical protein
MCVAFFVLLKRPSAKRQRPTQNKNNTTSKKKSGKNLTDRLCLCFSYCLPRIIFVALFGLFFGEGVQKQREKEIRQKTDRPRFFLIASLELSVPPPCVHLLYLDATRRFACTTRYCTKKRPL